METNPQHIRAQGLVVLPVPVSRLLLIKRGGARVVPFKSSDGSLHEVLNRFLALALALKFIALEFNQAVNLGFVVQHLSAKILP